MLKKLLVNRRRVLGLTATAALIAAPVLAAAATATTASAKGSPASRTIPHSKPTWLAQARDFGRVQASARVKTRVYLAPNGGMAALEREALAVSTPGSPQYAKFLTPRQYFAQFGTRSQTVAEVRQWLTGAGFTITKVARHNRYISIRGTVAAAERAFGTEIHRFRHDGLNVQAPNSELTAPARLASFILAAPGLDSTPSMVHPAAGAPPAPPPAGFRNAKPCSAYYGQQVASTLPPFNGNTLPYAPCGYVGSQFRPAYEGSTTLDGHGVTVAITDAYASPTIADDAGTYAGRHGDAGYTKGQLTQNLPPRFTRGKICGASGWYGEETLDVEAVHAMAQGAKIRYYASASCFDSDFLDTLARVDDQDVAKIVTNSWGEPEQAERASTIAVYETLFLQGATEGISYSFSSGDNGDEVANTGAKQADYPASDPFVTAVGGTTTAIGKTSTLAWETGWGTGKYTLSSDGKSWTLTTSFLYGAGGGASTIFDQPSYQKGIAPAGARQVPDVAMDADPTTGMLIGETQTFPNGVLYDEYRIGGTSLASPLFAGMTALSIQHAGHGAGLLNPTIYANAHSDVFSDVTSAGPDAGNVRVDFVNGIDATSGLVDSVRTFDQDSSLTVGTGWDDVTGLGSADSNWLTAIK